MNSDKIEKKELEKELKQLTTAKRIIAGIGATMVAAAVLYGSALLFSNKTEKLADVNCDGITDTIVRREIYIPVYESRFLGTYKMRSRTLVGQDTLVFGEYIKMGK